ncbi:uncharacterized protein LOC135205269 isoform X3 [Macrobrachium nipponense]
MEWTREEVATLIDLYRSHTILWDPWDEEFKNRAKKTDAWKAISECMQKERIEVEKKMKNLISQFYREVKKMREKKVTQGYGIIYNSSWFAFESLKFLLERNKHPAFEAGLQDFTNEQSSSNNDIGMESMVSGEGDEPRLFECVVSNTHDDDPIMNIKKKLLKKQRDEILAEEAFNAAQHMQKRLQERDEHELFGELVAKKIRNLPTKYAKIKTQQLISNILFEAQLGKYDEMPRTDLECSNCSRNSKDEVCKSEEFTNC